MRLPVLIAALLAGAAGVAHAGGLLQVEAIALDAPAGEVHLRVRATRDMDGDGRGESALLRLACADGVPAAASLLPQPAHNRDAATGQASGRGAAPRVARWKEWNPSSPQFRQVGFGYDLKANKAARTAPAGWRPIDLPEADALCRVARDELRAPRAAEAVRGG